MLNFYVNSIGYDMVNHTDSSTTCRSKFKAPPIKTKLQSVELLPKTWVAPNNRLTISDQKFKILKLAIREQNEGTTRVVVVVAYDTSARAQTVLPQSIEHPITARPN